MIELTRNVTKSHHHIKLGAGFLKELLMWREFISSWNGTSLFLPSRWVDSDYLSLYTDASGAYGFGGAFGTHWFQGIWLPSQYLGQPGISIMWQEFFAIVTACHLWANQFANKRIIFYCDNESVVSVINSKRSRIPRVMDLLRSLTLLTLRYNIYFKARHIPGKQNEVADSLSRFQMDRFRALAPLADANPTPIPSALWEL